jgi:hypothetical protein
MPRDIADWAKCILKFSSSCSFGSSSPSSSSSASSSRLGECCECDWLAQQESQDKIIHGEYSYLRLSGERLGERLGETVIG